MMYRYSKPRQKEPLLLLTTTRIRFQNFEGSSDLDESTGITNLEHQRHTTSDDSICRL